LEAAHPGGGGILVGSSAGEKRRGQVIKEAWYFNSNFPWLGMAICAPVIGLWYWCTDQYIVQRALGAPNEQIARRGSIFAAFLKLFPVYLFIIPRPHLLRAGQERKIPELTTAFNDPSGMGFTGGLPHVGQVPVAAGIARSRRRRRERRFLIFS